MQFDICLQQTAVRNIAGNLYELQYFGCLISGLGTGGALAGRMGEETDVIRKFSRSRLFMNPLLPKGSVKIITFGLRNSNIFQQPRFVLGAFAISNKFITTVQKKYAAQYSGWGYALGPNKGRPQWDTSMLGTWLEIRPSKA
jgi:hypothetical protein